MDRKSYPYVALCFVGATKQEAQRATVAHLSTMNARERTYNDKAYTSPHLFGQFFNFRILIKFFIHEVMKTSKF